MDTTSARSAEIRTIAVGARPGDVRPTGARRSRVDSGASLNGEGHSHGAERATARAAALLIGAVSIAFILTLVVAEAGASLFVELGIIAASFAGIVLLSGPLLRLAAPPTRIAVIGSSRTTCALA